ncbi:hypothetical protein FA95DRAFT_1616818 [Auriscalpium vulgare]|uniref:Uncharacterized protein n=1 Tax=Auriscalpium vulgare TaxID=40419 RepID=A0ACB8S7D6_9AGAM|nr:hypothetical protein FA95DRAFT_1616818 [Auriscalpium vulgare]
MTIQALPPYPSESARSSLSPSQLATLRQKIAGALQETLSLPAQKRDNPATVAFISSYAQDVAKQALQALVWDPQTSSAPTETREGKTIHARALLLAERLAPSGLLDVCALLDITIAYSTYPSRLRALLASAVGANSSVIADIANAGLSAFIGVFTPGAPTGLYGLRKAAHCVLCLLRAAPPEVLHVFSHSKDFVLVVARAYDDGLAAISQTYGGLRLPESGAPSRPLDEWERVVLETKVALMDTFHILFTSLVTSLARLTGPALTSATEHTFDIIFALHELPGPSTSSSAPTPFLNRPLLVDYQHAHDLSRILRDALDKAAADDARLEFITASLRSLDESASPGPGALKLLLGSGVPPGIDNLGRGAHTLPVAAEATTGAGPSSSAADGMVSEVRAILPDYAPDYVRSLLSRSEFGGSVERVVEALLEGTAPSPEAIAREEAAMLEFTNDRRNVFDDEPIDLSRFRVGKKVEDIEHVLRDRKFIEEMKSDILRRAEAVSDEEEEYEFGKIDDGKGKGRTVAFEEELDDIDAVRVAGDGEASSDEDEEDDEEHAEASGKATPNPETAIELAYIADPKVFGSDAATRRSKERESLRTQTGWSNEQIEGWRSMLDRNPKQKERLLAKHEFAGNHIVAGPLPSGSGRGHTPDQHRGRGGGRGGRGGGRGRGGGGRGGGGGDQQDRDRAFKDKNKASRGNHNRKRGHDKKMSRAGGPS